MKGACDLEKELQQVQKSGGINRKQWARRGRRRDARAEPGSFLRQNVQVQGPPLPRCYFSFHNPGSRLGKFQSETKINKTELNRALLSCYCAVAFQLKLFICR